jgi:hypothetical protein
MKVSFREELFAVVLNETQVDAMAGSTERAEARNRPVLPYSFPLKMMPVCLWSN